MIGRGDVILCPFLIETATYSVPGTVISTIHLLSHLTLTAALWGCWYYLSPFYRWGTWGPERLSGVPKDVRLANSSIRIWTSRSNATGYVYNPLWLYCGNIKKISLGTWVCCLSLSLFIEDLKLSTGKRQCCLNEINTWNEQPLKTLQYPSKLQNYKLLELEGRQHHTMNSTLVRDQSALHNIVSNSNQTFPSYVMVGYTII